MKDKKNGSSGEFLNIRGKEWCISGGWDNCYMYQTENPNKKIDLKNKKHLKFGNKDFWIKKNSFYERYSRIIDAMIKLCEYSIKTKHKIKMYLA